MKREFITDGSLISRSKSLIAKRKVRDLKNLWVMEMIEEKGQING